MNTGKTRLGHGPVEGRYLDKIGENRERAESLVRGVEVLLRKFDRLDVVPLDVLDRLERAIVTAHTSNLRRLPFYWDVRDPE